MRTVKRNAGRIKVLDSFRFFAILGVIFYHYYHRWAPPHIETSFYPYKPTFNLFSHGDLGVEFFFIISGFVIAFTLEGTDKLHIFWKKRMVRLLPAMITCSLVTLLICSLVDVNHIFPKGQSFTSFFYSITFLSPDLLNYFLKYFSIQGDFVNGSYWSLWVEVQFYFLVSLVFFLNKKHYVRNFFVLSLSLFFAYKLLINVKYGGNFLHLSASPDALTSLEFWLFQVFNITTFINWFLIGVLFYKIYSGGFSKYLTLALIAVIAIQFLSSHIWEERITIIWMALAFFALIFFEEKLEFLNLKWMTNIGAASYSLYLIHENIGVVLINRYASSWGEYAYLFPLLIMAIMIGFSMLHFKYIEKPIGKLLR